MAEQERRLRFDRFDQDTAWNLGVHLRELALARGVAVTIEIRLARETVFLCRCPERRPPTRIGRVASATPWRCCGRALTAWGAVSSWKKALLKPRWACPHATMRVMAAACPSCPPTAPASAP